MDSLSSQYSLKPPVGDKNPHKMEERRVGVGASSIY